jgi:hypothetical protein
MLRGAAIIAGLAVPSEDLQSGRTSALTRSKRLHLSGRQSSHHDR